MEIGNAQCRIEALQPLPHASRVLHTTGKGIARRSDAQRGLEIGPLPQYLEPQDQASSYRPAKKWADAVAVRVTLVDGPSGLKRIARARCSIARSGSPSQVLTQPLAIHAAAKFGLSSSARSIKAMPASSSRTI